MKLSRPPSSRRAGRLERLIMPARALDRRLSDEHRIGDAGIICCALDRFALRLSKPNLEFVGLPFVGRFRWSCHELLHAL